MIVIEKWSGLITNASPYALPGGACAVQTNLQCLRPGELRGRSGLTQAATVAAGQVVSAVRMPVGSTERVICQCGSAIVVVAVP
jgi:hypothetical protein